MTEYDNTGHYIDLQMCQSMLDEYKASMRRQRQQDPTESTGTSSSSDVRPASSAAGDELEHHDDSPGTNPASAATTAAAADRQQYVNWDTMQEMSKAAAMNDHADITDPPSDSADSHSELTQSSSVISAPTVDGQPVYATVNKSNQNRRSLTATLSAPTADTNDCIVVYANDTKKPSGVDKKHVTVTPEGVEVPIRFVVQFVGSFPMSDDDHEASSNFVIQHVRRLCDRQRKGSVGSLPSNVVYYWPTDVDITLELSGKYLRLIDTSKGSELHSQPLRSVRQWSKEPGTNSRHFAYVSPEPKGARFVCHVFRCCGDCCADDVTSTLRRVCLEMQRFRQQRKMAQV